MRRWLRLTALAGAIIALAAAGTPAALGAQSVGNPVLKDCNANGVITQNFTLAQLRHALAIMPASYKEYGNCLDAITAAIVRVRAGKPSAPGSGSGGSFLPTPVIVLLVVLILAAVTFGALALRRRGAGPGGGPGDRPGGGPGGGDGGGSGGGDGGGSGGSDPPTATGPPGPAAE